jgi:NTP pyrophosphatase (non-canonical NTP hydrolase)
MQKNRKSAKTQKSDIQELTELIVKFNIQRNWAQFHNPKDLALSLTLEAAEVLEKFQWKSPEEIDKFVKTNKKEVAEELADTFYWILLMAYYLKIDIKKEVKTKMRENSKKYPVRLFKGSNLKYTKAETLKKLKQSHKK